MLGNCALEVFLWINSFNTHNSMSSILSIHILHVVT